MKVFIVEDSEDIRRRLIEAFAEIDRVEVSGYAESESEALERILDQQPEVVVLDLQLRQGSGLNVLRALRKFGALPRVIVLTNHAYAQYLQQCMAAGADYFFDKATEFMKVPEVLGFLAQGRGGIIR